MATIRVKRGQSSTIPPLEDGELGYCKDTKRFYIGTAEGNVEITTKELVSLVADGLMSKEDKAKLDGIQEKANNYTLPTASSVILGGIKLGEGLRNVDGATTIGDIDCGTF